MRTWNTIRTFYTPRFALSLAWTYEEDGDLSWDDTGEVAEKINSGEWTNCTFRVQLTCDGRVVAVDYLGNSVYANPEDFGREHVGSHDGYFRDMVAEVIAQARKTLTNTPKLRCGT